MKMPYDMGGEMSDCFRCVVKKTDAVITEKLTTPKLLFIFHGIV